MKYETLLCETDAEGVLLLTLNRPDRLNAFSVEMAEELESFFQVADEDDDVRAIVVTGAGRAFCAGMDLSSNGNVFGLNESLEPTLDDLIEHYDDPVFRNGVRDTGGRVTLSMYRCRKPIIGAINGPAIGIGVTMTLAMDVRLASDKARFGFVFGKLGITPEACSTWFLPRIVGLQQAFEWVYSGEVFDAAAALQGRLIRSVHSADSLLEEALLLARNFVKNKSPAATALARQMLYRNSALPEPIGAHRIESLAVFYASRADGKEGVQAFREKRAPEFLNKASDLPPFYPWWG